MKTIVVQNQRFSTLTTLYIGEGIIKGPALQKDAKRAVIIADATVAKLYAEPLALATGSPLLTIPSGESSKTQEQATLLIHDLLRLKVDRETTLVAIGGGMTTDLVGFVASIYMRGVPLILIPTTLLAMVDAAIGGKTAVDTPFGKNLIGTTYYPTAVYVDLDILCTLSREQQDSGLAEILKLGLVYNASLFTTSDVTSLIVPAIEVKLELCAKDPMDLGIRRLLNFGHTIAHGLEATSDYEISHGQAVLIGCLVESHLSMRLGYLPEKTFAMIEALYRTLPLQLPKRYERSRLLEVMARDKKSVGGKSRFVLIDQIGHAMDFDGQYCQAVDKETLIPTLQWMEATCTS